MVHHSCSPPLVLGPKNPSAKYISLPRCPDSRWDDLISNSGNIRSNWIFLFAVWAPKLHKWISCHTSTQYPLIFSRHNISSVYITIFSSVSNTLNDTLIVGRVDAIGRPYYAEGSVLLQWWRKEEEHTASFEGANFSEQCDSHASSKLYGYGH